MATNRSEALTGARKLCRTMASAPLPQARARELFQVLIRARGWSSAEEAAIAELGAWLDTRPAPSALKDRCEKLLGRL
jgi:hypothetical protein